MIKLEAAGFDERNPQWRKPLSPTTTHAVALIVTGQLHYRIDGSVLRLGKGDLLYIPANCMREAYHAPAVRSGQQDYHQKYWVTFTTADDGAEVFPMLGKQSPVFVETRYFEYMKQRFSLLLQQWIGKLAHYDPICTAIVTEMIGHMNRELDDQRHPSPKLDIVKEIQQYVLARYRGDIRVDRLAEQLGLTPNYVSSVFRQLTGSTVKEYVHQVKLSAARDLLLGTDITIGEAADYVGFCDQSYFNRVFKKVHGFPPSALLKERML